MNNIRPLSSLDAEKFQILRIQAVQTDPYAYLSTIAVEQTKPLKQYANELLYSSLIPPFGYYGVFTTDNLRGFVQLGSTGLPKQKHIAFLYNLYVDPAFRGQHLATQLCEKVTQIAQHHGIESLFAYCLGNNPHALDFYTKLGFSVCGERVKSVKHDGEYDNEIELVKVL